MIYRGYFKSPPVQMEAYLIEGGAVRHPMDISDGRTRMTFASDRESGYDSSGTVCLRSKFSERGRLKYLPFQMKTFPIEGGAVRHPKDISDGHTRMAFSSPMVESPSTTEVALRVRAQHYLKDMCYYRCVTLLLPFVIFQYPRHIFWDPHHFSTNECVFIGLLGCTFSFVRGRGIERFGRGAAESIRCTLSPQASH